MEKPNRQLMFFATGLLSIPLVLCLIIIIVLSVVQ